MLNIIWPMFIIISFVYAIFTGNAEKINSGIFDSCKTAVDLSITFLGTMCLWTGIMEIAKSTKLIENINKAFEPLMKFLFPEIKKNDKAYAEISMNIISNILGLGNAATPIGLKAMKSMQESNKKKDTLSDSMIMFILVNTASIQIIPTTVLAIRTSLNSNNPTSIVFPIWISSIIAASVSIILTKIAIKKFK